MNEFELPERCTIENIEPLHLSLSSIVSANDSIIMNGKNVSKVDSTFLQLLFAIEASNKSIVLTHCSEVLKHFLKLYHMKSFSKGAT